MPWVCFTCDYDWQPDGARWMVSYKAGRSYLVKEIVAEAATKAGKAKRIIERPENAKGGRFKIPGRLLHPR